ncbi:Peroxidase [Arachis hypogaea]|nr:Peroxidase [Arachis hypogaea]
MLDLILYLILFFVLTLQKFFGNRVQALLTSPNPRTYIGSGKVSEIKSAIHALDVETVIFYDELSPGQLRNLEKVFGGDVRVCDRTALILDIFNQGAATHEASLQVSLAQMEYQLPRLTKMWTHLERQSGGKVKGGEKQIEVDKRILRNQIGALKKELESVRKHRQQYRNRRFSVPVPVVALVGYTNAGKSTLLNQLTGADVFAEDKLFATLDPTTRRVQLKNGKEFLLTDTVGFIQKLPTQLVAAFRATLEEISESSLLVHVVDISHPLAEQQINAVDKVLSELDVSSIPRLMVWNKVDKASDPQKIRTPWCGLKLLVPFENGDLLSTIHQVGMVEKTCLKIKLGGKNGFFAPFLSNLEQLFCFPGLGGRNHGSRGGISYGLSPQFYQFSCPQANGIVMSVLEKAMAKIMRIAASLLRLHFHDCFVQGCDASILLDDSPAIVREKNSGSNKNSVRGFEVIDEIKAKLEEACPQTVSCADILVLAARGSTILSGGPNWELPLGRRDSRTASLIGSNNNIPPPNATIQNLITFFKGQGLDEVDLVALSGAHTIGVARCATFKQRLYNQNEKNEADVSIERAFYFGLKTMCPRSGGDNNISPLDFGSPRIFDNTTSSSFFKEEANLILIKFFSLVVSSRLKN